MIIIYKNKYTTFSNKINYSIYHYIYAFCLKYKSDYLDPNHFYIDNKSEQIIHIFKLFKYINDDNFQYFNDYFFHNISKEHFIYIYIIYKLNIEMNISIENIYNLNFDFNIIKINYNFKIQLFKNYLMDVKNNLYISLYNIYYKYEYYYSKINFINDFKILNVKYSQISYKYNLQSNNNIYTYFKKINNDINYGFYINKNKIDYVTNENKILILLNKNFNTIMNIDNQLIENKNFILSNININEYLFLYNDKHTYIYVFNNFIIKKEDFLTEIDINNKNKNKITRLKHIIYDITFDIILNIDVMLNKVLFIDFIMNEPIINKFFYIAEKKKENINKNIIIIYYKDYITNNNLKIIINKRQNYYNINIINLYYLINFQNILLMFNFLFKQYALKYNNQYLIYKDINNDLDLYNINLSTSDNIIYLKKNRDIYNQIFTKNYSIICQKNKQPKLTINDNVNNYKYDSKNINFPYNSNIFISCNSPEYMYPGLIFNKKINSDFDIDPYKLTICCYKKKNILYKKYYHYMVNNNYSGDDIIKFLLQDENEIRNALNSNKIISNYKIKINKPIIITTSYTKKGLLEDIFLNFLRKFSNNGNIILTKKIYKHVYLRVGNIFSKYNFIDCIIKVVNNNYALNHLNDKKNVLNILLNEYNYFDLENLVSESNDEYLVTNNLLLIEKYINMHIIIIDYSINLEEDGICNIKHCVYDKIKYKEFIFLIKYNINNDAYTYHYEIVLSNKNKILKFPTHSDLFAMLIWFNKFVFSHNYTKDKNYIYIQKLKKLHLFLNAH